MEAVAIPMIDPPNRDTLFFAFDSVGLRFVGESVGGLKSPQRNIDIFQFLKALPPIHIFAAAKTWMAGTSPGHDEQMGQRNWRMLQSPWDLPQGCVVAPCGPAASLPSRHETIEECRKRRMAIERNNVGDVLVWPHHHHAAAFTIDAAQGEDVLSSKDVLAAS